MIARTWGRLGLIARIAISSSVVLLALAGTLVVGFVRLEAAQHSDEQAARLEGDLSMLVSALAGHSIESDPASVETFLAAFAQRPGIESVAWTDTRGNQVAFRGARVARSAPAWLATWAGIPALSGSNGIVVGATHYGEVSLRLNPVQAINRTWDTVAAGALLVFTGFGVLLVAMLFTVKHGLSPMARLVAAVVRFGGGEFDVRVKGAGPPEIVSSIHAFNRMADRVGSVLDSLRDAEAQSRRMAMIVEQSSDSILTCDLDLKVTFWNRGAERLFGWSAQEAIGTSVRELHMRNLSDEEHARMLARMLSAAHWAGEGLRVTKAGATLPVWVTLAPLLDEKGEVIGTIAMASDSTAYTDARQAQEQATEMLEARVLERTAESRRNESLLRSVMGAMPGVVTFHDAQLRYQLFNPLLEEWLQMDAQAIRGKTPIEVMSEESHRILQPYLEQAVHGKTMDFEWTRGTPDGTQRDIATTLVPMLAASGECVGVTSFSMDISERKRADVALRASEARTRLLATMVDQSIDAILARDLNGQVVYWNHGAERVHGFSPEEAIGQPLRSLHLRELSDDALATVLARFRSGVPTAFEVQRQTKAGKTIDVATTTTPWHDETGQLVGAVVTQRDVTAARNAERELLRAKEAAEAASQAKSEFLANMSHEIRTPLNGVLGITELVLQSELTREQRSDLELVQSSGKSLMTIINDILDFSKIEAGQMHLESIEFAPADSVCSMVQTLAQRAHEKGIELIYDAHPLPPLLLGDPGRLRQIVINLVGNAIKFTQHGEVAVSVRALPDAAAAAGAVTLQVSVRDSGIGIPKEKLASIFEAFTQADTSTTRRYGGTGLGLSICAKLVQLMGGEIGVDSELGQGSTFSFTMPCGVASAAAAVPAPDPCALSGESVLVVEDNECYRDVLVRTLTGWGLATQAVGDAESALAMLNQAHLAGQPAPLLLLDVALPGMDGFALAEHVKRSPHLARAVVVLTGAAQRGDAARCRELGVAGYLSKPVQPSELFKTLLAVTNPDKAVPEPQLVTRHSLREAHQSLSILVAEDNETNQLLAKRVLLGLGHRVRIANNGQEALDAVAGEAFDLVLMDMQMPVMGGLEAAAAIRSRDAGGGSRLPIVALTANAMQGDRDSCLAAGMDDFLTKPFSIDQIRALLERWLPDTRQRVHQPLRVHSTVSEPTARTPAPLDVEVLKGYVGDDNEIVGEFLRSYLASSAKAAVQLRDAHRDRRADVISDVSHQLKSTARTVGALQLGETCARLEDVGKEGDWAAIDAAMAQLDAQVGAAASEAEVWLAEHVN